MKGPIISTQKGREREICFQRSDNGVGIAAGLTGTRRPTFLLLKNEAREDNGQERETDYDGHSPALYEAHSSPKPLVWQVKGEGEFGSKRRSQQVQQKWSHFRQAESC